MNSEYVFTDHRGGQGTAVQQPGPDPDKAPELSFAHGDSLDGSIDLADFARLAGMELRIP